VDHRAPEFFRRPRDGTTAVRRSFLDPPERPRAPAPITQGVRSVADRHSNDPFSLLGVSTVSPIRNLDREGFKSLLKTSRLPARFWWDVKQDGKPGPIQTAWNARIGLYVLDRNGVIRFKDLAQADLMEKAVTMLLNEQKQELKRSSEKKCQRRVVRICVALPGACPLRSRAENVLRMVVTVIFHGWPKGPMAFVQ
jgi:hypothetical protein